MTYTPTNPHTVEVEVQAWDEGLLAGGLHDADKRNELNPYTSGDTCVAWARGYDDAHYELVVIDWSKVDLANPAITQKVHEVFNPDTGNKDVYLLLVHDSYRQRDDNVTPAWRDNRWQDRSILLQDAYSRNAMYHTQRKQPTGTIDLPCPPYEYEVNGNELTFKAGAFYKTATKQEFQAVVTEIQEQLDAMPDGIDISDVSVTIDCTATAQATWTASISATTMLDGHEQYVDDVWAGTMDELTDALDSASQELELSDLDTDYSEVEYDIDYYSDVEVELPDLTYDLNDATEL